MLNCPNVVLKVHKNTELQQQAFIFPLILFHFKKLPDNGIDSMLSSPSQ